MYKSRFVAICFSLFILLFASAAFTDEGMWMLHTVGDLPLEQLQQNGLTLTARQIYSPDGNCLAKAVVNLGGGTASFVSKDGLLITNHHVAFGALQRQASAKQNLIQDGFRAKTRQEEIPAKNYLVYVLKGYKEVTGQVLEGVTKDFAGIKRFKAIEKNQKALVEKCESGRDARCEIYPFFEGLQYYMYTYFLIRDVRVVYAPPVAVGSYGGEIDNWMWPRHAADFAFMRAYVAPDGASADYSKDNVPYHPENFLKISTAGYQARDIALVMGYPYRTMRYRSSFAADNDINFENPWQLAALQEMSEIYELAGEKDPAVKVTVASSLGRIANYRKKTQGELEGLEKVDLVSVKKDLEQKTMAGLSKEKREDFQDSLDALENLYKMQYAFFREKKAVLGWMTYFVKTTGFAVTINKWSIEKNKEDMLREPEYMERNIPLLKERLRNAQADLDVPTDKRIFRMYIKKALALPADQRIRVLDEALGVKPGDEVKEKTINKFIDKLYKNTKLTDETTRLEMFELTRGKLLATKDRFIEFAADLEKEGEELRELEKHFSGSLELYRPEYIKGILAGKTGPSYPDANFSMRFSYGYVKGYSPRDAVDYHFQTRLSGLVEKNTNEPPFDVPAELLDSYKKGDFGKYKDENLGDVPVDFLTTNDGTGGNSGSAILNGNGELIGLMFDTNYEAVFSDYYYAPNLSRAVNVDIRFVLFILDKVYHVDNVLQELGM